MSVPGIWPTTGPRLSQQGWLRGMLVGYAAGVGFCASIAVMLAAYTWSTCGPKRARADSGQPVASKTAPAEEVATPPEHAAVRIAKADRLPSSETQVEKEQIARPRIEKSPPVDVAGGNPETSSPPPIGAARAAAGLAEAKRAIGFLRHRFVCSFAGRGRNGRTIRAPGAAVVCAGRPHACGTRIVQWRREGLLRQPLARHRAYLGQITRGGRRPGQSRRKARFLDSRLG